MKKEKYKISILITNYNKSQFLKKSLGSVLNQDYKNYEIILYDDCSTDSSLNIIKKHKKVRLIKGLKKDTKNTGAQNQIKGILQAFKKSKGKIICLMDSDDFFSKNKLKVINDFYQKNKDYNCVFNLPKTNKNLFNFKKKYNNKSIWPTIFPTSCVILRRPSFLRFIKYIRKSDFPNLEIDARITIFSYFFLNEYNIVNKKLTFYSYDQNGITSNIKKFSKVWWIRRKEAYIYLKYIMHKKKTFFKTSVDYYITILISYFLKI
ncbi:glycosyltransferase [Candidatus Pelagibacter sp.]|nr:glycosyltransferase [Candidatus Pelagibacter sp.]